MYKLCIKLTLGSLFGCELLSSGNLLPLIRVQYILY